MTSKKKPFFVVLPSSTYLLTVSVEGFDFSLDHIQAHTTFGTTPLDEGSVRRRDLYVTTQTLYKTNIHAPVGFEPTIPASARPQTYALDSAATGIATNKPCRINTSDDGNTVVITKTKNLWIINILGSTRLQDWRKLREISPASSSWNSFICGVRTQIKL
jgi:hypothetical protein